MPFRITITEDAKEHLEELSVRDRAVVRDTILSRLVHEPRKASRAIKRLRPNSFANFEPRVGNLRVLYDVEGDEVVLLLVGRKIGNSLVVKGERFHGHQDHLVEPPDDGSAGDAE